MACRLVVMSATISGGLAEALLVAMEPKEAERPEGAPSPQPSNKAPGTPPAGLQEEGRGLHACSAPGSSSSSIGVGYSAAAEDRQPPHLRQPVLLSCEGRSYPVRTKYLGPPGACLAQYQLSSHRPCTALRFAGCRCARLPSGPWALVAG